MISDLSGSECEAILNDYLETFNSRWEKRRRNSFLGFLTRENRNHIMIKLKWDHRATPVQRTGQTGLELVGAGNWGEVVSSPTVGWWVWLPDETRWHWQGSHDPEPVSLPPCDHNLWNHNQQCIPGYIILFLSHKMPSSSLIMHWILSPQTNWVNESICQKAYHLELQRQLF